MNTQQESQSGVIEAIFDIPIISRDIHEKLFFDLGGEMVVFHHCSALRLKFKNRLDDP